MILKKEIFIYYFLKQKINCTNTRIPLPFLKLKMNYSFRIKRGESIIYIILWLTILLIPIFISKTDTGINWLRVQHEWVRFLPFAIVFIVHNYLLFPQFFIQKKRILYILLTIVLILLAGFFGDFIANLFHLQPFNLSGLPENTPNGMQGPRQGPPMGMGQPQGPPMGMGPESRGPEEWHKKFIDNALVSILVVGFNAAIKLTVKWQDEEQKNKELEKEKLQTELAFLKNQVSPHFFMNTLNNIHALIDINSEDAKESVIKLSKLMRYLLYDSEVGKTTLIQEIEFIKSYVDLMKLRFTSHVSVKLSFPDLVPNIEIPPMLFTSLLENAFKHGITYQKESFVEIIMKADKEFLFFKIRNSKKEKGNGLNEPGGIGLDNLHKRLELIYNNRYTLEQKEDAESFEINIKLPINE